MYVAIKWISILVLLSYSLIVEVNLRKKNRERNHVRINITKLTATSSGASIAIIHNLIKFNYFNSALLILSIQMQIQLSCVSWYKLY